MIGTKNTRARLPVAMYVAIALCLLLYIVALTACGQTEEGGDPHTGESSGVSSLPPVPQLSPEEAAIPPRPQPAAASFRVTFRPQNGKQPSEKTVQAGYGVSLPEQSPEKSGAYFLGWYTESEGGKRYDGEVIAADTVLYAHYAEDIRHITFNPNGGVLSYITATEEAGTVQSDFPVGYKKNMTLSGFYYDSACTRPYGGEVLEGDTILYAGFVPYFDPAQSVLPEISVDTGRVQIVSKDTYIAATVQITGAGEYNLPEKTASIRGRGNSTWTLFEKKAYRLKFDEKTDLFGMGAAKSWVLLANAADPTMLHNYAMFTLAGALGDSVTSPYRFVTLRLNGEYMGVYLLCEQVEEGKTRVPIDDGASGSTDTGYLIEFGGNAYDPDRYGFRLDPVQTGEGTFSWRSGFTATVKSPDETVLTSAQAAYITDYVNRVNRAIVTGDYATFCRLCDEESFIRAFLVNMVLMNSDMDFSFYFYKKEGGKLYMGPLWDCDQSCGTSSKTGTITGGWYVSQYESWLTMLIKIPAFYQRVAGAWNQNRALFLNLPAQMRQTADEMRYDIDRNYIRWQVLGRPYWRQCREHFSYTTYDEHLDFFTDWLTRRIRFLDYTFNQ